MSLIKSFLNSVRSLMSWGSRVDRTNREEIRNVVLKLVSELERGMTLVIIYLEGARDIVNEHELANYLRDARSKLLNVCNEFHVCSALYTLCDRFQRVFDMTKLSIEASQIGDIQGLLGTLRHKERGIIDDIAGTLDQLQQLATNLTTGSTNKAEIHGLIQETIDDMRKDKKSVKRLGRKIIDTM